MNSHPGRMGAPGERRLVTSAPMRASAVTVLCAVTACGGGSIPFEQLNTELVKALCAKYEECGLARSQATCISEFDGVILNDQANAIAAGRVKYDGSAARTCVNALSKVACTELSLGSDESCDRVYEGQVAVGATCGTSTDCVSSAYCAETTTGMACSGTCTTRVAAGGMATRSSACEEGLRVIGGVCTKPPVEGEACTQAGGCDDWLICGSDLKCRKPGEEGAACDRTNACALFLSCVGGTCRRAPDVGESCAATLCKVDLYCDPVMKLCAEPGAAGASCTTLSACRKPLVCTNMGSTAGMCTSATPEGQSCATVPCDFATYCESATKLCKKRIAVGQPCPSGTECERTSNCTSGTCRSNFGSCP